VAQREERAAPGGQRAWQGIGKLYVALFAQTVSLADPLIMQDIQKNSYV